MRVNLTPLGGEGESDNFLLWPDGSSLVDPCPSPGCRRHRLSEPGRGARSRLVPGTPGGKHSVPPAGSDYPFVLTQSILAQFLFLSLALFLHLPCQ